MTPGGRDPAETVIDPATLYDRVALEVARHPSVAVAFSAGVDSTVVLAMATRVLGTEQAVGIMGVGPAVPPAEVADGRRLAEAIGARLAVVDTHEIDDERYVANPPDRCFFCKTELYAVARREAQRLGLAAVLNGTNTDDVGDWRPGLVAADDAGVASPLRDAGLDKAAVRALAQHLGLPNWDKPALACLASRLPYGTAVTPARLSAVDAMERWLRARGFREVRARHHGAAVRLEVEAARVAELETLVASGALQAVAADAGFTEVDVEPDGFRSGRLNDDLPAPDPTS